MASVMRSQRSAVPEWSQSRRRRLPSTPYTPRSASFTTLRALKRSGPRRTPRHARISETFRRLFVTSNPEARRLHAIVQQLFKFRDWAVHPPADFRRPVPHDALGEGVEWRFVAFGAPNALVAVQNAAVVIRHCVDHPRQGAAAAWSMPPRPNSHRCGSVSKLSGRLTKKCLRPLRPTSMGQARRRYRDFDVGSDPFFPGVGALSWEQRLVLRPHP